MTELEQKLITELESREQERERELSYYKQSLIETSKKLIVLYQQSQRDFIRSISEEQSKSIELLNLSISQQNQIIKLLRKPSTVEPLSKQMQQLLNSFLEQLSQAYSNSNKELLSELKILL